MNQGDQTQFFPEKDSWKRKTKAIVCYTCNLLSHWLMDSVTKWSINQFSKKFFHLSQNIHAEEALELT